MARRGTSADHQLKVYNAALEAGAADHDAQIAVVDWLIAQSVTPDGPPAAA
jgi:carboxylate-amine ligase